VRFTIFAFLIAFLVVLAVPASALDGWIYYRSITITNNAAQTLTDYQVSFTLDTANLIAQGKMRSDCGDLRVTLSDGQTLLPYWIEPETCNTNTTRIWTKVPSIPASGSITLYVWYGNPQTTSAANGSDVFDFFDDFDDGVVDTSKWDVGTNTYNNYVYENNGLFTNNTDPGLSADENSVLGYYRIYGTGAVDVILEDGVTSGWLGKGLRSVKTFNLSNGLIIEARVYLYSYSLGNQTYRGVAIGLSTIQDKDNRVDVKWISSNDGDIFGYIKEERGIRSGGIFASGSLSAGQAYRFIYKKDTLNNFYASVGNLSGSTASTFNSASARVGLTTFVRNIGDSIDARWDWFFVRKYASAEPSISIGNELIAKPDLTIISADYSPKPASVQQQVNINAQIANVGNWTSPIANVTLYINGNAVNTAQISGLSPNTSTTVTLAWVPNAIGNYTATIVVDPDNLIDEINKNNNTYNLTIEVIRIADLTVNITAPPIGATDKTITFNVTIANVGSAAAYNFGLAIYIDSTKIDEKNITSLDPNGQITFSYSFTPHEARTYMITAVADPRNNVIESRKDNNVVNVSVKILGYTIKPPAPPKPEGKTLKEIFEDLTLKTYNLPLEIISLIALLGIAVVGYGFGAFKGTVNLFFLSVLYYIAANALGWSTYIATGLLVVSAVILVIVVAFLKED